MEGIYCYTDLKTNEIVYIGKDSNIHKNKRHHDHFQPNQYHTQQINRVLQNNPNRYSYRVLKSWKHDKFHKNLANALEILYIKRYFPRFNFTIGGEGITGFKHSIESRKKMSEAKKGKKLSETTRKKMSIATSGKKNPMYGKHHSKESREKISKNHADVSGKNNPHYGKKFSNEICKNMSKSKNTSGYFRVYLRKEKENIHDRWVYRYLDENGKRKSISSIDMSKLELKVKAKGLEWFKLEDDNIKEV